MESADQGGVGRAVPAGGPVGAAAFVPLPYVTYYPGPTVVILGTNDGTGEPCRSPATAPTATTASCG